MISSKKITVFLLFIGDLILLYAGLYLTLLIRYRQIPVPAEIWITHNLPFFFIHILWLFIFYISGLYEIRNFSSYKKILEIVGKNMAIGGALAVLIFYIVPALKITPKLNLLTDVIIVSGLLVLWRRFLWSLPTKIFKTKIIFLGNDNETRKLFEILRENTHLGYEPYLLTGTGEPDFSNLIKKTGARLIIASRETMRSEEGVKKLYEAVSMGITIVNFSSFYEKLVEKIPLYVTGEEWFLENITEINKKAFEKIKKGLDIIMTILLAIPTLMLFPLIAVLSKLESSDKILVRQDRIGKNGKIFTLIKFRTMYTVSEPDGKAKWTEKKDKRITRFGKILRKTSIDELPQIWNVLKGDMSFIGPRPERPEFVEQLQKEIPHYGIRHLVKPGLSGWAQIKFPYGASMEDAKEKLRYDIYYVKNRSIILDLAIVAKTIGAVIGSKKR